MDASTVIGLLERWYFSPLRVWRVPLLLGPMGVGKSTSVRAAAARISARLGLPLVEYSEDAEVNGAFVLVDFRLAGVASEDLVGLPRPDGDSFTYRPMHWVKVLQRNPGILLLDEITNVTREDVKSRVYEIALMHRVGFHPLHEGVMVVLAGNTDEHSSIAFPLPDPLKSRTLLIKVDPPKVEQWIAWMDENYGDSWDRRVGKFLLLAGRKFFATTKSQGEGFEQLPDPRAWTHLAFYLGSGGEADAEVLAGFVGKAAATEFVKFLNIGRGFDDILKDPSLWSILDNDAKFGVFEELVARANMGFRKELIPLLKYLAEEDGELFVAWILNLSKEALREWLRRMRDDPEFERILRKVGSVVRLQ